MCIYLHEYSIIFFLFVHYYIPLIVHLYFTLYNKYDPARSSLKNWIAGIARYKCLDYLRKVYKDKREQSINGQVQVDISYIETEIEEDLDHILGGLSDIDKRIVKFRFIEGYSIEEISNQLSLSKKTVYNRIYYAKQKIIKRIGGISDEKQY